MGHDNLAGLYIAGKDPVVPGSATEVRLSPAMDAGSSDNGDPGLAQWGSGRPRSLRQSRHLHVLVELRCRFRQVTQSNHRVYLRPRALYRLVAPALQSGGRAIRAKRFIPIRSRL